MIGKPSNYTEEIGLAICELIATTSKSMKTICEELNVKYGTHLEWRRTKMQYSSMYALAKEDQADLLAEEIIEIADDNSGDVVLTEDGKEQINHENIARSRLRVDARKFIAAKLKPKKYGERIDAVITTTKQLPDWMSEGDE